MNSQYSENTLSVSDSLFKAEQSAERVLGELLGNFDFENRQIVRSILGIPALFDLGEEAPELDYLQLLSLFEMDRKGEFFNLHEGEYEGSAEEVFKPLDEQGLVKSLSGLDIGSYGEIFRQINAGRAGLAEQELFNRAVKAGVQADLSTDKYMVGQVFRGLEKNLSFSEKISAESFTENLRQGADLHSYEENTNLRKNTALKKLESDLSHSIVREGIRSNLIEGFGFDGIKAADELGVAADSLHGEGLAAKIFLADTQGAMVNSGVYLKENGLRLHTGLADIVNIKEDREIVNMASGSLLGGEGGSILNSHGLNNVDSSLVGEPPLTFMPEQEFLYEPSNIVQGAKGSGAAQAGAVNRAYTIQIEGRGKVELDGAILKEQVLDTLTQNIRPLLIDILDEEMFAESEGSYYF